jgi:hypothetical protein
MEKERCRNRNGLPDAGYFGNVGRNTLIGPGLVNFDFSLVKSTPFAEGKNILVEYKKPNPGTNGSLAEMAEEDFESRAGARQKDLRDLVTVCELDQSEGGVVALEDPRFDMKVPSEIEVPLDGLSCLGRQVRQVVGSGHVNSETFGAKIIRNAFAAPDDHRRRRVAGNMNQDAIGWPVGVVPHFDFMGRLPQRKFAKSKERLLLEEVFQCLRGFVGGVDNSSSRVPCASSLH